MALSRFARAFWLPPCLFAYAAFGPPSAVRAEEPKPAASPVKPAADPDVLRIHLMDGSQVGGKLGNHDLEVDTNFGKLTIPVGSIVSLTPGLASHPQVGQSIAELIDKLGSPVFAEREAAQKALAAMGPPIRAHLARAADDNDTERKTRVRAILDEFDQAEDDADSDDPQGNGRRMIERDTVETTDFTIVGKIVPQEFEIFSQYGVLRVHLNDIRRIERVTAERQDLQKSITVDGTNLIARNMKGAMKDTGMHVERGDKVAITADGTITMMPWGNQALSTPDGAQNYGWYLPNQISGGTLVGKIGDSGPVFRIGSKLSFTADKPGTLHVAVALQADPGNQAFPGEYQAKIRVKKK